MLRRSISPTAATLSPVSVLSKLSSKVLQFLSYDDQLTKIFKQSLTTQKEIDVVHLYCVFVSSTKNETVPKTNKKKPKQNSFDPCVSFCFVLFFRTQVNCHR